MRLIRDDEWRPVVKQSTFIYPDFFGRPAQVVGPLPLDDVHEFLSVQHQPEQDVLAVKPRRRSGSDKKLTSVRIRAWEIIVQYIYIYTW